MARKRYIYNNQSITADNQQFLFSSLGVADENITLPVFVNPPIINILSVQGDTIVNLHPDNPPTKDGFTIIIGSVGQVPSSANPIPFSFEIIDQDTATQSSTDTDLILASYVKDRFPEWQTYCTRQDALKTADEMLQIAINDAAAEFQGFLGDLTAASMTDDLTLHLFNIVRFRCFNFRHGDSEMKQKPEIVKAYNTTRELLEKGRVGAGNVKVTSKERQFDEWFTDNQELWYEQT